MPCVESQSVSDPPSQEAVQLWVSSALCSAQRVAERGDEGQGLILDLDQPQRVLGQLLTLCGHRGHLVPDEANGLLEELPFLVPIDVGRVGRAEYCVDTRR